MTCFTSDCVAQLVRHEQIRFGGAAHVLDDGYVAYSCAEHFPHHTREAFHRIKFFHAEDVEMCR